MRRRSPAIGALILLIGLFTASPEKAYAQDARGFIAALGNRASGGETVVTSEIARPNGSRVLVDWYVIERGGAPRITDVYVGGVSMKVTQRDEFASVIQRNGGRVDALLAQIRQRIATAR